jgi:hypothetical protein
MIFQLFSLAFTGLFVAFGIAAAIGHFLLLKAILSGMFGEAKEPAASFVPLMRLHPAQ